MYVLNGAICTPKSKVCQSPRCRNAKMVRREFILFYIHIMKNWAEWPSLGRLELYQTTGEGVYALFDCARQGKSFCWGGTPSRSSAPSTYCATHTQSWRRPVSNPGIKIPVQMLNRLTHRPSSHFHARNLNEKIKRIWSVGIFFSFTAVEIMWKCPFSYYVIILIIESYLYRFNLFRKCRYQPRTCLNYT